MTRTRRSIQQLEYDYNHGKPTELENLIKAFRGIQALPPDDRNSFFKLAAAHGQPFRGPGVTDPDWWGGYCNHDNVLFPTWHRALLWRFEEALRSIEGCKDVTLPYWDELIDEETPLPKILTSPTFPFDTETNVEPEPNPLYSYKLQEELVHHVPGDELYKYSKHKGYETVRYPHSGLVGTEKKRDESIKHNANHTDAVQNASLLNTNVKFWLDHPGASSNDFAELQIPDTLSVRQRYLDCLNAPNYTVFSNNTSRGKWIETDDIGKKEYVVSLESPHNAIHVSLGTAERNDPLHEKAVKGANGDMGFNETAGFDPIFFLHHCFVDYVFWYWQRKWEKTKELDLLGPGEDGKPYPGTFTVKGLPHLPPGTNLTMETPLYPFRHRNQKYMTSRDVTDIVALGYDYEPGSIRLIEEHNGVKLSSVGMRVAMYKHIFDIERDYFPGSFVIRTTLDIGEKRIEIGREAILSRMDVSTCDNCQDKLRVSSFVPIFEGMMEAIVARYSGEKVMLGVEIQTFEGTLRYPNRQVIHAPAGEKPLVAAGRLSSASWNLLSFAGKTKTKGKPWTGPQIEDII